MKEFKKFGNLLTTGQLAKQADLPKSTLQYYLSEGLLKPDKTSPEGYFLFEKKKALAKLKKIKDLQNTIESIKKKLK